MNFILSPFWIGPAYFLPKFEPGLPRNGRRERVPPMTALAHVSVLSHPTSSLLPSKSNRHRQELPAYGAQELRLAPYGLLLPAGASSVGGDPSGVRRPHGDATRASVSEDAGDGRAGLRRHEGTGKWRYPFSVHFAPAMLPFHGLRRRDDRGGELEATNRGGVRGHVHTCSGRTRNRASHPRKRNETVTVCLE